MTPSSLTRSLRMDCPICGKTRSPIGYAHAKEVHASTLAYHRLGKEQMMHAYQVDQLTLFRKLMDYDKVLAWARTTTHRVVGMAHRKASHPLQCYLNEVNPAPNGPDRWDIFPSACDALKGFVHLPHSRAFAVFGSFHIHPTGVTYDLYLPLPSWTQGLMARLEALSFDTKISRELLVTMLHAAA